MNCPYIYRFSDLSKIELGYETCGAKRRKSRGEVLLRLAHCHKFFGGGGVHCHSVIEVFFATPHSDD